MRIVTFNYILFTGDLVQYLIVSEKVLTEVQKKLDLWRNGNQCMKKHITN